MKLHGGERGKPTNYPESRCPSRCLLPASHPGACLLDDQVGTPRAELRARWEQALLRELERLPRQRGRPRKMCQHETVSDLVERYGISRATIYRLWRKQRPDEERQKKCPALTEKGALRVMQRVGRAVNRAAGPDPWRHLDNPEAKGQALEVLAKAAEKLDALIEKQGELIDQQVDTLVEEHAGNSSP